MSKSVKFHGLDRAPRAIERELDSILARGGEAAAELKIKDLEYIGAGASGVVFAGELDGTAVALKVARLRDKVSNERQVRADFLAEADYTRDAEEQGLPVAPLAGPGYLDGPIVLVKELVAGEPGRWTTVSSDVWRGINDAMADRWGPIEFKEENFVRTPRGPVLVDAGGAVRRGENLLQHAWAVTAGRVDDPDADNRGGELGESYLRWSIRMDAQDGRISKDDADEVIVALDEWQRHRVRSNPAGRRREPPEEHPPCPRCGSTETRRVRNYGRPVGDEFQCLDCRRRWDRSAPTENPAGDVFRIKLTKGEAEWASWAIDPMEDFWNEQVEDGEVDEAPPLPRLEGSVLVLPDHADVIEDFLFRIEEQAPDMVDDEAQERHARVTGRGDIGYEGRRGSMMRPLNNLAQKIRRAAGLIEDGDT